MPDVVTEEEFASVRDRMRSFIDDVVIPQESPLIEADVSSDVVMDELRNRAKSEGLWALGHPAEIGGGGLTFMQTTFLNEVVGRSYFGQKAVGTWSMQDSLMLLEHASEEQRSKWLVPLVTGEIRSSVGLTEPEVSGSDPTLMQSTAHLDGDEWVVNAHKWFTTGANIAAFTTMFVCTEPDGPPHDRYSAIIVPTRRARL